MPVSIWGIKRNGFLFPYRDLHMETGINRCLYGNQECSFPYGESKEMATRFHKEIAI
jgi:hypothetical protein